MHYLFTLLFSVLVSYGQRTAAVEVCTLEIGSPGKATVRYVVELALTSAERERGLMERTALAPGHGMLFDFGSDARVSMWMKNTPLALDMMFITTDGVVSHLHRNAIPQSTTLIPSNGPVRYVLEVAAGDSAGLAVGSRLNLVDIQKCLDGP
jgi:uncharacterized protein